MALSRRLHIEPVEISYAGNRFFKILFLKFLKHNIAFKMYEIFFVCSIMINIIGVF